MLCIASTKSGRIFFGCVDNDIYEFDYSYNYVCLPPRAHAQNFFYQMLGYSSRGQIANRTGYLLQLIIPTFLRELSYGDNIDELQVDDDRHIL